MPTKVEHPRKFHFRDKKNKSLNSKLPLSFPPERSFGF